MKLYETNKEIERLTEMLEYECDPETGEIVDLDAVEEALMAFSAHREEIIRWLAKEALNARSDAEGCRAEEKRLADQRRAYERKYDRLLSILDREDADKVDLEVTQFKRRKTTQTVIEDEEYAVLWLTEQGYEDAVKVVAPTVNKAEVKKIIKLGNSIPGVTLVEGYSVSLK